MDVGRNRRDGWMEGGREEGKTMTKSEGKKEIRERGGGIEEGCTADGVRCVATELERM